MFATRKILILSMFLFVLTACKKEAENTNAKIQSSAVQVPVITVEPQSVPLTFTYGARAVGYKDTQVRARVGGILLKRYYTEGTPVQEGDLLFEIDQAPYKVALAQAKAKLSQVKAQLSAAETQWIRISKLFKDRIVSEKSRDEAKSNLDSLKASVEAAQAEVDAAELNLGYTQVRAPISGITSLETQSEGSLIVANSDSSLLTTITQVNPIYVIFSAADTELYKLGSMIESGQISNPRKNEDGSQAREVYASLTYNNGTKYSEQGKFDFINPTVDEKTGTIKIRAVFPNPDKTILPGMFVRLNIKGLTRVNALVVPQEAVMQGAEGPILYRVNIHNQVEAVDVETGFTTPDGQWIIDSGLNAGDKVIVGGLMQLSVGQSVTPVAANPSK